MVINFVKSNGIGSLNDIYRGKWTNYLHRKEFSIFGCEWIEKLMKISSENRIRNSSKHWIIRYFSIQLYALFVDWYWMDWLFWLYPSNLQNFKFTWIPIHTAVFFFCRIILISLIWNVLFRTIHDGFNGVTLMVTLKCVRVHCENIGFGLVVSWFKISSALMTFFFLTVT